MRRWLLLIVVCTLIPPSLFGQSSSSTDAQTLQALLTEVRHLRHDLHTVTIASQRAQILIYKLQMQEGIVARTVQRLDEARTRLAEAQRNRSRMANDIRQNEDIMSRNDATEADRKIAEDSLPVLKASLPQLQVEEQERQTRAIEVEEQFRAESTKLADLQQQLDQLDKSLEKLSHELAVGPTE